MNPQGRTADADSSVTLWVLGALAELRVDQLPRLVEHIPAAVAVFDRDMRFIAASQRWRCDYHVAESSLAGRCLYEVTPGLPDRWREMHRRCLAGAVEGAHDEPVPRPDGTIDWIHWECSPWLDGSGAIAGLVQFTEVVTNRKQAEALDERYRMLARHGRDLMLFVRRADGRILEANDAALEAYGYTHEELVERTIHELRAPGTLQLTAFQMSEADKEGLLFETVHRRKDGSEFPVEVSSRGATIGGVRVLLSIIRDITLRRERAAALLASEKRNRDLVHLSPDAIFIDRRGRVEYANPAAVALFGAASEADLTGREVMSLLHPRNHERIRERVRGDYPGDSPPTDEMQIVRMDGSLRDVEATGAAFRDAQGLAHQVLMRDITERKRQEALLREAERHELSRKGEARFRALIEHSVDVLIVVDAEGTISFWSPGAESVLGWSESETIGRASAEFTHPDDVDASVRAFGELAGCPGASFARTIRLRHRDGSWRLLESMGRNLLHDPDVRGIVINSRDVTEQHELQRRFLEAQKLESIGRLAGGVAHDFNNLLTAILGGAEALDEALHHNLPPQREDVEAIQQAGARARDLTRQLLSFARRQVIAPEPLDLNLLVGDTEKLLRRLLPGNIRIAVDLGEGLGMVLGDLAQIQQVIVNLSVNARDAMPDGGTLAISTRASALDGEAAAAAGLPGPCRCVRLIVHDTGVGMDAHVRSHLFEPFFTTKPQGKGTGLGLAAVYGIVTQNHGRILVQSEPGRGTTIAIDLPCTARRAERVAEPEPGSSRGTETVLLVEDEALVRDITARALRRAGYDVRVASDPAAAVEALDAVAGGIHLLVTDLVMPGMNGRELAALVVGRHPGIRTLFVSGYAQDAIGEGGVLGPGMEFLQKPFRMSTLLARVRGILDGAGARNG